MYKLHKKLKGNVWESVRAYARKVNFATQPYTKLNPFPLRIMTIAYTTSYGFQGAFWSEKTLPRSYLHIVYASLCGGTTSLMSFVFYTTRTIFNHGTTSIMSFLYKPVFAPSSLTFSKYFIVLNHVYKLSLYCLFTAVRYHARYVFDCRFSFVLYNI